MRSRCLIAMTLNVFAVNLAGAGAGDASAGARAIVVGDVPDRVVDAPAVALTRCAVVDGQVEMEGVVTNNAPTTRFVQGVPYAVGDRRGVVEDSDDHTDAGPTIHIGAGRQAVVRATVDVRDRPDHDVTCAWGPPDFRSGHIAGPLVDEIRPPTLALGGCLDGDLITVENETTRPIGVLVVVEFFDENGFSVGQMEHGQYPTDYSDGRLPGPGEVALAPGNIGRYPIEIESRIEAFDINATGIIAGCEVISARSQPDPPAIIVIVG